MVDLNTIIEQLIKQPIYIPKNGCYGLNEEQRFLVKIQYTPTCWLWMGGKKEAGYGHFGVERDGRWGKVIAHRYAYEQWVGPIPEGYEIDHTCLVRNCVRPDHLEAVTLAENRRRRDERVDLCEHVPISVTGRWGKINHRCQGCGRILPTPSPSP